MVEHQQAQKSTESKSNIQTRTIPPKQIPISNPMAIIQRARINPKSLTHADVMQLQCTIGNRAVGKLLTEIGLIPSKTAQAPVKMQQIPEEEKEPLQGKMAEAIQRQEIPEEEEPLQSKMIGTIQRQEPEEEEKLQMKPVVQRQEIPEDEEPLQSKFAKPLQRQEIPEEEELLQGKFESKPEQEICPSCSEPTIKREENLTGLPDNIKAGVENLSGIDMSDVRVRYNSDKPAEVGALAYTQGIDIHVASGQERHLPHEMWHVVQQKQGKVQPTKNFNKILINDDLELEREADLNGTKILQKMHSLESTASEEEPHIENGTNSQIIQRDVGFEFETGWQVDHAEVINKNSPLEYFPLKKKDKIGTINFDGYKMEADEAGEGLSEIEFIVYPPVQEGKEGLKRLTYIMDSLESFGLFLENKAATMEGNSFLLKEATGYDADTLFRITPMKKILEAGPQVTSGLDLEKIGRLRSLNRFNKFIYPEDVAPRELESTFDILEDNAQEIAEKNRDLSSQLQGLLVLIKNYLEAGCDKHKEEDLDIQTRSKLALNYPKRIADVLLARTDFGKLFSLIPKEEQRKFISDPNSWVDLVMGILPDFVKKTDSVIQRGIQVDENDPEKGITIPDLTIEYWLKEMLKGIDRLSLIKDAESMGEMKGKTEKVGKFDQSEEPTLFSEPPVDAGIFEFRRAQTQKLPLLRWKPFAIEFLKFITRVHR